MAYVPSPDKPDVIIIGAGAAGLAALVELHRAGLKAFCLEARDRIGGRIFTVHDPSSPVPIELGAEFIHGRPAETWDIIQAAGLTAYDCTEDALHIQAGRVVDHADAWLPYERIMAEMQRAANQGRDQSFKEFLASTNDSKEAKKLATSFVEGFNAAHDDRIGIASLALDGRASESIDGNRSFRILNGYDSVPAYLFRQARNPGSAVRLNSIVEGVKWRRNAVTVSVRSSLTGQRQAFESSRLIVSVPLGVLQAEAGQTGVIDFDPPPSESLAAARKLCFGQVFRMVLRFTDRIWERKEETADTGFFLSDERVFPTWWTPLPMRAPIMTGWSAGRKADPLLCHTRESVIEQAIERLACVTSLDSNELRSSLAAAYFHDWREDPFSRGAYSYVPVDGLRARELLARPVEDTLYFSGEATETNGHGATVHGAIASGIRAAFQILQRPVR